MKAAGLAISLLRFQEAYFDRIWGGARLRTLYDMPIPGDTVGEAWLISDHVVNDSVVRDGPHQGVSFHALLEQDPETLLGRRPRPTVHGRFPLMLKLIDAQQPLSVQVHPDDACAAALGEPDVGKTEMWHVLHADHGSTLITGLEPSVRPEAFMKTVEDGSIEHHLVRHSVKPGDSLFVPAGTVHAIGAGIVLAEIQQNSDLTYRLYDWRRFDDTGKPRTLHLEKARRAVHFGAPVPHPAEPPKIEDRDAERSFLAACPYFAAELVRVNGVYRRHVAGESFHILLAKAGLLNFNDGQNAIRLFPGQATLLPGAADHYEASGNGQFLDYYVPDLQHDILLPLLNHNYTPRQLVVAGLAPAT